MGVFESVLKKLKGVTSVEVKPGRRFDRVAVNGTVKYSLTVNDPATWTAPFTISFDLGRDNRYGMFEYACHEGNRAMANILSGARATEIGRAHV